MRGAELDHAYLFGADLLAAQFQGASLYRAQLQAAFLEGAQLQGANLDEAVLQGAFFGRFEVGSISKWIRGFTVTGRSIEAAQLQGASLRGADLQGASLEGVQIQGADLEGSKLTFTDLSNAHVWRTKLLECQGMQLKKYNADAIVAIEFRPWSLSKSEVPATPESVEMFIDKAFAGIPDRNVAKKAIERMRSGLLVDPAKDDTEKIQETWRKCQLASESRSDFEKQHAVFLSNLVCDAEKSSRDAIANGVVRNWMENESKPRDFSAQLARGLLGEDGKHCAATKDLGEATIELLRGAIAAAAPSPAPASPVSRK